MKAMSNVRKVIIGMVSIHLLVIPLAHATIIVEDFETTARDSLPIGWIAVAGAPAVESGATGDDGFVGNALFMRPVGTAALEVPSGPSDNFRLEVDISISTGTEPAFVHFRGPDLANGYQVGVSGRAFAFIQKVVAGTVTTLAAARVPDNLIAPHGPEAGKWYHLIVQVEGNLIRLVETKSGADLTVTDDTFGTGSGDRLFLGAIDGFARYVAFDNLTIEDPVPHEPADPISLPFTTGFEVVERSLRNGAELPPNIDAFIQGGSYLAATADTGTATTALFLTPVGTAVLEVSGGPSDNFHLEVDISISTGTEPAFVHFRGPDLANGYQVGVSGRAFAFIQKVVAGTVTTLAAAQVPDNLIAPHGPEAGKWYHLIVQVEGNLIRLVETKSGADLTVTDDTFGTGPGDRLFLGAIDGFARYVAFDNLTIQSLNLAATIDVKPGSFPNSINPRSRGVIPVAILTTDTFDATTVDPSTVFFGAAGTEAAPVRSALEDVDGDGDTDMILHFNTQDTGIVCGATSASLSGETLSGQAIEGSDSIRTVGCK